MHTYPQKHNVHPLRRLPKTPRGGARADTAVPLLDNRQLPMQLDYELDDVPLSVWAARLYQHLVRVHGKDGCIMPSYLSMGEKCYRATLGPKAAPESLRRKAILAMNELIAAGLVVKKHRGKPGTFRSDSDTNAYRLLDKGQWLAQGQQQMARLRAETEAMKPHRAISKRVREMAKANLLPLPGLLQQGRDVFAWIGTFAGLSGASLALRPALPSVVASPAGVVASPAGVVGSPKVVPNEVHQPKSACELTLLKTRARPRDDTPPAPVEMVAPVGTHPLELESNNGQERANDPELPSTNGSADAPTAVAPDSQNDLTELPPLESGETPSTEQVPGGAAAAGENNETIHALLKAMLGFRTVGKTRVYRLPDLLLETPAGVVQGGVNRHAWLSLDRAAIIDAQRNAVAEAKKDNGNWFTKLVFKLDELIGAQVSQPGVSSTDKAIEKAGEERALLATLDVALGSRWESRTSGTVWTVDTVSVGKGEHAPKITLLNPATGADTFVLPSKLQSAFERCAEPLPEAPSAPVLDERTRKFLAGLARRAAPTHEDVSSENVSK